MALFACQWGTLGVFAWGWWILGVSTWSAWLPAAGLFFGTALYVWRVAPDATMADRSEIKWLASQSGLVAGAMLSPLWLVGQVRAGAERLPALLVATGLVGLGIAFVVTLITLVGLDAGRTNALAQREEAGDDRPGRR